MNYRQKTINTYKLQAKELASYYAGIGDRQPDVVLVFCFLDKTNPKVIEIGCGGGRETPEIMKYTKDYTGMDVSAAMIDLARQANPGVRYEVGDIATYAFPKGIDAVFAFASLLHSSRSEIKKA